MKSKYARVYVSEAERPLMQFLVQYFDPTEFVSGQSLSTEIPERKLLLALIADAIHALEHPAHAERYREAVAWFEQESRDGYPFSFGAVCEALGLSESYLRKKILKAVDHE